MIDDLKPCPFCGSEASDTGYVFYPKPCTETAWDDGSPIKEAYFCNCPKCGISNMSSSMGYRTKAQAIAAWNARALPAVSAPVAVRPSDPAHIVEYTNYRGETARRVIIPIRMWWGKTEWHPEEQWLLTAWDVEKNASRDFAWQDMRPVQNPATSAARIMAAIDAPDVAALVEAAKPFALLDETDDSIGDFCEKHPVEGGYVADLRAALTKLGVR